MKTEKNRFVAILTLVCTLTASIFAQQIQVSGNVTNAQTHELLIGVNVKEKGSNKGTLTDIKGHYTISTQKGKKLEFSYIGFLKSQLLSIFK